MVQNLIKVGCFLRKSSNHVVIGLRSLSTMRQELGLPENLLTDSFFMVDNRFPFDKKKKMKKIFQSITENIFELPLVKKVDFSK